MAVIRVNKTSDYTVMSNSHLREKEMSLKAKGLLSVMLSLPDNWDYSVSGLCAICKENEGAVKSALKELKKYGYLVITRKKSNETESGHFEYVYDVYEKSQITKKPEGSFPPMENPAVENPAVENQGQLNTNIINTDLPSIYELDNSIVEIVDYLNKKSGKKFSPKISSTQKHIAARLKEGRTVDDFKKVIDTKCAQWLGTNMAIYIRPETLFTPTHFENYLNETIGGGNNGRNQRFNPDLFGRHA